MDYIGAEEAPAPQLRHADLSTAEAPDVLDRLLWNVELFLGDDNQTPSNLSDDVGVRITNGSALFLITPAGFAGEITASASLRISDGNAATVNQVRVAINNLSQAVDEQFRIGGSLQTLSLPMGPFVRVELNGLTLTILGQRLSGDFAVERVALGGPVTITAANVALRIGTDQRDFVTVSNGQGFLRISGGTGLPRSAPRYARLSCWSRSRASRAARSSPLARIASRPSRAQVPSMARSTSGSTRRRPTRR